MSNDAHAIHQLKTKQPKVITHDIEIISHYSPGQGAIPGTTEKEGDSTAEKAGKGILRSVIGLLTYQRTIRVARPDPKHCMYNIKVKLLRME